MKRNRILSAIALFSLMSPAAFAAGANASSAGTPHGSYVEARTASVFAGACHYNGERVTDGRSAVMAWQIDGGTYAATDLAGVRVMAAVTSDSNLADESARRAEIVVDAPTDAAAAAAVAWAQTQTAGRLGTAPAVRRGAVTFTRSDAHTTVASPGFANLAVRPMPDGACCSQPHLVWYTPLATIDGRRVGYTETASYTGGKVGDAWQRADENGAFYGHFGTAAVTPPTAVAVAK